MKKSDVIQKKIDEIHYWDAEILGFDIRYFGDEITIILEDDKKNDIVIKFISCYKVDYETDAVEREREVKTLERAQLPYFAHDIHVSDYEPNFVKIKLQLPPLFINIICKDVLIERVSH
ncbi:hypothetical protein [Paenibacillus larvae]|uniref:Uncharacterized protein n=1 Tax=Paenibacillus larvae subsp. larvae TaxID=147375 RepID=A0A6C0QQR8_9BACL|nr:hypothetical protein [Paenibacillus larvae]MCY7478753.1 hypothetical protein [Paenibacillus larvae]MDE5165349.1 hypothetical protein [Paenibacillus larvae subsp. larvae]QHZ51033.1 hypothetical protein ERICV_01883 [Paenibacillus larvae subsp. larvae]